MTSQGTFIARLRRHRERCGISLDVIASETRIKREQLEAFERGDLSIWPNGLYARAWIRGYAAVVGLDPSDTVDEFCRLFSQGDRRAGATLRELGAIISHPVEYHDEFDTAAHEDRRQPAPGVTAAFPEAPVTPTWRDHVARAFRSLRPTRAARAAGTIHGG